MTSAMLLTISRFASRTAAPTRESLTWQQLAVDRELVSVPVLHGPAAEAAAQEGAVP